VASHFGGTRSGFLVSWPARIKAQGEIRSQWHHFVDVAPTIYEAENDKWELYDLRNDFSEADDLAAKEPAKLKEMQALFDQEAKRNNVYPLDDRFAERAVVADRPSVTAGRTKFIYYPGTVRVPEGSAPKVKARSHRITAEFEVSSDKPQGVIVAEGGSAGYTMFAKDGYLMYENNFFGKERDLIKSAKPLPRGNVTAVFEYTEESTEYGGGGTGRSIVNGELVGEAKFAHVPPARYSATESFDIGTDTGEAVSNQYEGPLPFSESLQQVEIELLPERQTSDLDQRTREAEMAAQGEIEYQPG
jgi:hypothetical protein